MLLIMVFISFLAPPVPARRGRGRPRKVTGVEDVNKVRSDGVAVTEEGEEVSLGGSSVVVSAQDSVETVPARRGRERPPKIARTTEDVGGTLARSEMSTLAEEMEGVGLGASSPVVSGRFRLFTSGTRRLLWL